jgi:hypothetical protein
MPFYLSMRLKVGSFSGQDANSVVVGVLVDLLDSLVNGFALGLAGGARASTDRELDPDAPAPALLVVEHDELVLLAVDVDLHDFLLGETV